MSCEIEVEKDSILDLKVVLKIELMDSSIDGSFRVFPCNRIGVGSLIFKGVKM
jgi:hypothetical protein